MCNIIQFKNVFPASLDYHFFFFFYPDHFADIRVALQPPAPTLSINFEERILS